MAETLEELLQEKTKVEQEAQLLAALNYEGFEVTNWNVGSVPRTIVKMITLGLLDHAKLVSAITSGGYLSLATGDWLTLLADEYYDLQRAIATYTVQRCEVTCGVGAGPKTVRKGSLCLATSGRRYEYTGADAVISDGATSVLQFTAESPGAAYNDGAGRITQFVTSIPGLTITNPAQYVGGLDSSGRAIANAANSGTGTVTPTGASGILNRYYTITITAAGQVTAGAFQVDYYDTVAGGSTTVESIAVTPIPASWSGSVIGDPSLTVAFANGGVSPSFASGDSFTFWTPGSPIVVAGADEETDAALANRCKLRWPSLSDVPTEGVFQLWIYACSVAGGYGITKATVLPSATIGGMVEITVATAAGAPSGGHITALQTYVDNRIAICEQAHVQGASTKVITPAGTAWVKSDKKESAQAAAEDAWNTYLGDLPIGGDTSISYPGVVRLNELQQALMDAGAIEVSGLLLNGAAANVSLLGSEVAITGASLVTAITWLTVA